jgi:predicted Holliday junction resolvase-like endonuclease
MSGWLVKLSGAGMFLLLVVSICLGGYSSLLSHRLELARKQVGEQEKTLAQQSGLISTLQEQDRQNRVLAAEQQRREQQLRQQGETYQRKLRDALKSDKCRHMHQSSQSDVTLLSAFSAASAS